MRVVVAIGGNAITQEGQRGSWDEQLANARVVASEVVRLKRLGHEVVLTHGNGPQVGALHLQHDVAAAQVPPLPLDVLVAMTQGQLGYLLQTVIGEIDPAVETVTVLTRVRVDPADPSFGNPTKPIGQFYSEDDARRLERERGFLALRGGEPGPARDRRVRERAGARRARRARDRRGWRGHPGHR